MSQFLTRCIGLVGLMVLFAPVAHAGFITFNFGGAGGNLGATSSNFASVEDAAVLATVSATDSNTNNDDNNDPPECVNGTEANLFQATNGLGVFCDNANNNLGTDETLTVSLGSLSGLISLVFFDPQAATVDVTVDGTTTQVSWPNSGSSDRVISSLGIGSTIVIEVVSGGLVLKQLSVETPEPGTLALFLAAAFGLASWRVRQHA